MAAGQLSLYGAQQILAGYFGRTNTPPENWFFALTTALATPSMNGSEISEPTVGNYSRLIIPNDNLRWTSSANAPYVMNAQMMYFPISPVVGATADWPPCYGWALCDGLTGGNVWALGTLSTPVSTPEGFCASLGVGALSLELSPFYNVATS